MSIGDHHEYEQSTLDEAELDASPIKQFQGWLQTAIDNEVVEEANAMTIATVGPDGAPSARIVLVREVSDDGLTFFTNYESRKGLELAENQRIAAVFFWPELQRSVRVEGTVTKLSSKESDEYFAGRPIKSQIGAIASPQSQVIESRAVLEAAVAALETQDHVTRPDHWGGYRIRPNAFEFWQGRRSRLHDRLRYRHNGSAWIIERLAP